MISKPKYNFYKNTIYALKGMRDLIKTEVSFKIELVFVALLSIFIYFVDFETTDKLLMFITLMLILICEAANSAIERVVDLVTLEYNEMAGRAKDAGSAMVFLSILLCVIVWSIILIKYL
ncbi:MAG: diacylglycerol kinase [Campylobacterota bacterium]|nr:diacylglycerol kinase [Campylobacterota bacterium]